MSQIFVDGPKHEPAGQWDASFYLARKQDEIDEKVIQTLFKSHEVAATVSFVSLKRMGFLAAS